MTTIIIGAFLIGITLGLLGSGGSTITVPVLVYLVGHDAKVSIAESMAIVGFISAMGVIPYARAQQVDWRSVWLFGVPAMFGTFLGAYLGGLSSNAVQLIVFGVVLLLAAAIMFRRAFGKQDFESQTVKRVTSPDHGSSRYLLVLIEGTAVGLLTGFVGVGGGFLIVPALLILGKLPMKTAIGTSLVIIVMKSTIGFAKYQHYLIEHDMSVDWTTIVIFSMIGLIGCLVGQLVNSKLNQRALIQVFAVFLILVGAYVIVKESTGLINPKPIVEDSIVSTLRS